MRIRIRAVGLALLVLFASAAMVVAQEEDLGLGFGFDLGIGAESFPEFDSEGNEEIVTYQTLSLNPDLAIGPFGIGLDVTLHYRFTGGETSDEFEIREEDWIPVAEGSPTFLELYLPLFRYVRWGLKGEPLFIKLGSIDDATLGNGFIMGNYSNTLFLPEKRIFGLNFDIDGNLFEFPYVGFESFIGNLAHIDVLGGRLYARPLAWLEVPIIQHLELGGTLVADIDPYFHVVEAGPEEATMLVYGADFQLPIVTSTVFSLVTFGDLVFQNEYSGGMLGFGGSFFGFLPYVFQARFLGDNFRPVYFGPTYDLYRVRNYEVAGSDIVEVEGTVGWFGRTGFSFLDGMLSLNISIDGPFEQVAVVDPDNEWVNWPHLRGVFHLGEGLIPGLSFDAFYDKKNIQLFEDLIDPTDAVIGITINYATGPAVLTLEYDIKFNPDYDETITGSEQWETTARLKSSISIF